MKAFYIITSRTTLLGAVCGLVISCSSTTPPQSSYNTSQENSNNSTAEVDESKVLTIRYSNQSTSIKMDVDPFDEDLYIDMKGGKHAVSAPPQIQSQTQPKNNTVDTVYAPVKGSKAPIPKSDVEKSMQNLKPKELEVSVLANIRRAQEFFYKNQYDEALNAVNKSLQIQPTSEGYALMGSIYYMMEEIPWAIHNWKNALDLNPDMVEIQKMLEKIKRDEE